MKPILISALLLFTLAANACAQPKPTSDKPNVVIIYMDDVGYGDLSVYGAEKIQTPNLDELARTGLRFTSSYATAATCTPSRYSLLTGQYAFRNTRAQILDGDAPLLLDPEKPTMATMFQQAGYQTAVIGKWHLGLGDGSNEWNRDIKPGPLEIGFHESFIVPTTVDRVPTVYVQGHRVVGLDPADPLIVSYKERIGDVPTGLSHPELLRYRADTQHSGTIVNGVSRIGFQSGGKAAHWDDETMTDVMLAQSKRFMSKNKDNRFFLFLALHQNHVPRVPNPRFLGSSQTGLRGDHTVEMDWAVGEVVRMLTELGIRDNTMIIFGSDNGPIYDDGYADGAIEDANGHKANGPFRGGKYTAYEGATRLPFIVNWPSGVSAGGVTDAAFSQVDLLASLAALVKVPLAPDFGPDSVNQLETLLGRSTVARPHILQQGAGTDYYGLRVGDWKLIPATNNPPVFAVQKHNSRPGPLTTPMPARNTDYLYHLASDPGETTNLAAQNPEVVAEMKRLLNRILSSTDREILSQR